MATARLWGALRRLSGAAGLLRRVLQGTIVLAGLTGKHKFLGASVAWTGLAGPPRLLENVASSSVAACAASPGRG